MSNARVASSEWRVVRDQGSALTQYAIRSTRYSLLVLHDFQIEEQLVAGEQKGEMFFVDGQVAIDQPGEQVGEGIAGGGVEGHAPLAKAGQRIIVGEQRRAGHKVVEAARRERVAVRRVGV